MKPFKQYFEIREMYTPKEKKNNNKIKVPLKRPDELPRPYLIGGKKASTFTPKPDKGTRASKRRAAIDDSNN